jgi:allophanate hydrolase
LSVKRLQRGYQQGEFTPADIVEHVIETTSLDNNNTWISLVPKPQLRERGKTLTDQLSEKPDFTNQPLFGIPFGVKDNIDCAGQPTTAACPTFKYTADDNAPVVQRAVDAGAILVGKTNLDQFATGVVGTRSPYGVCQNAVHPEYISGGSSSGSAVAVAKNQVTFALGTDTGGSGRVPAACNSVIGMKPTRGLLSKSGVVPACKSLDCVSIFGGSCLDVLIVERILAGFDPDDEYSRHKADILDYTLTAPNGESVIGFPRADSLNFFSDKEFEGLFEETHARLKESRFSIKTVNIDPFLCCSKLLFDGPWIVERKQAIEDQLAEYPDGLLMVIKNVLSSADEFSARDVFIAEHKRKRLQQRAFKVFELVDCLIVPTIGTMYTVDEVREEPIETNTNLGLYTNFVNLLDLSAVAIPAGQSESGVPFGVTLVGKKFDDASLVSVAHELCIKRNPDIGINRTYEELI